MNTYQLAAEATKQEQATFYKKTYLNLALGIVAFVILETAFLRIEPLVTFMLSLTQGYLWLLLLGGFMGVTYIAQNITYKSASLPQQYLGYFLYIIAEALIFVPILYIAIFHTGSTDLLTQAAIITGSLFLGLTFVVFSTKADFSFLRSILAIGFFVAIGAIIAGMLFNFDLGLWFSVGMIVLASGSILYNTHQIKNNFGTNQYIAAALSLFASLMLLFWYVLRLLMSRN
ncbi:Bax inhibitor-1 family protein [Flavobacterium sp. CBA20B-1]|uniref:Bax inhibitor-1/YccA family protein n=1 Tax=unclassified Flavobacterium TaxID=196869 RepID=UPI002225076E|nr:MULTISPECIES: Bax inhibitor-1 family protein [unclassified Flavobacterium]WCM41419.1 Bax inhibitor-1 family protein [Flavobacterium sp. CBA20B-1]